MVIFTRNKNLALENLKSFAFNSIIGVLISVLLCIYHGINQPLTNNEKFITITNSSSFSSLESVLDNELNLSPVAKFFMKINIKICMSIQIYKKEMKLRICIPKSGDYIVEKKDTILSLLRKIARGNGVSRKLVVANGLSVYEIDRLIRSRLSQQKVKLNNQQIKSHTQAEGIFMPDTYLYNSQTSQDSIRVQMTKNMMKYLNEEWKIRDKSTNDVIKNIFQLLALASIIEKESDDDNNNKIIAGVFLNRLRKGIPLQSDTTISYSIFLRDGYFPQKILYSMLKINSPYNTYKNKGLPPTAICCPSRKSIRAALHPVKHNFLFFIADSEGNVFFSDTYKKHMEHKHRIDQENR